MTIAIHPVSLCLVGLFTPHPTFPKSNEESNLEKPILSSCRDFVTPQERTEYVWDEENDHHPDIDISDEADYLAVDNARRARELN